MSNVVQLPSAVQPLLSKRQLGEALGRSSKWIELRVREGMPRVEPSPRFPRARYRLDEVEAWLADGQRPKQPPTVERLAALERTHAGLRATVEELQARLEELESRP